jgi:hypothetical protein
MCEEGRPLPFVITSYRKRRLMFDLDSFVLISGYSTEGFESKPYYVLLDCKVRKGN